MQTEKKAESQPTKKVDEKPAQAPPQASTPPSPPPKVSPPARPPTPPSPPSRPQPAKGRRNFIKAMVTVSAILSMVPFVPWGSFLSSTAFSAPKVTGKQKIVLDNSQKVNGSAGGKPVNVNDLTTFPPNGAWQFTYPSSGDPNQDAQNPDTFVKFQLIRLPGSLGSNKAAADFVALSKVCVHLWCSPNYDPQQSTSPTDETYQCPCHGSIYRVPDGLSIAGPASQQPPPTNAIPMLTLSADSAGVLYVELPVWDVDHNGVVGYGRYYDSYQNYILPAQKAGTS